MAIEQINHYGKTLSFIDRDGSGFTAQVTLDMPELVAILNAIDDERFDEVIALAEKHRAEKAVSHLRPQFRMVKDTVNGGTLMVKLGEPCPFCHDRAEHDPEWKAICENGMKEEKERKERLELEEKHHPGYQHAYKAGRCIYRGCGHRQTATHAEVQASVDSFFSIEGIEAARREKAADRKADRQDAANRRREMAQEMRDSYAR